jgi:hypothetical protein
MPCTSIGRKAHLPALSEAHIVAFGALELGDFILLGDGGIGPELSLHANQRVSFMFLRPQLQSSPAFACAGAGQNSPAQARAPISRFR